MKKLLLVLTLSAAIGAANAQDLVNKNGTPILPEAKDWGIGFDAKPVFNYIGNMFNNTVNNTISADFQHPYIITGKYFKNANTAYRVMFRLGDMLTVDNAFVNDENSQVLPPALVTDTRTTGEYNLVLGFGKQKYRGKGRLRGYYGWEGNLSLTTQKQTFAYGNQLNSTHNDASLVSNNFGAILNDTISNIQGQSRITEQKIGTMFGIGARAYIGIEYFFAAKFSIGAEYGWGLSLQFQGEGEQISEAYDLANSNVVTTTTKLGNHSVFNINTDNASGAIFLSAYF